MSEHTAKELAAEVVRQRNRLVQTLVENDVSASQSETINTLIPKVGKIAKRADTVYGERTLLASEQSFQITGIPFEPSQIAVVCEKALGNKIRSVTDYVYVALLSLDTDSSDSVSGQLSTGNGLQFAGELDPSEVMSVTEQDGTYTVSLSFDGLNSEQSVPVAFAPFYTYTWAIC